MALQREDQIKPAAYFLFHMNQIIARTIRQTKPKPISSFIGDVKVERAKSHTASDQSEEMKQQQAALFFLESESTLGRRKKLLICHRLAAFGHIFSDLHGSKAWLLTFDP